MRNEDHPLIDCPHRGCARGRQDYEQRLQEQRSHVVRSDVHRTAPHTSWVEVTSRRFPLPWSIEDIGGCFIVKASNERPVVFIYYGEGVARRSLARLLTRDAARWIATGIAKLPDCFAKLSHRWPTHAQGTQYG
jgi:hypothetical protein